MADKEDLESRPIVGTAAPLTYSATAAEPEASAGSAAEKLPEPSPRTFTESVLHRAHQLSRAARERIVGEIEVRWGWGAIEDSMTYSTQDLSKWTSLVNLSLTVWRRRSLWEMAFKLFGLSIVVAMITTTVVSDPSVLQVAKFSEISKFLNVFVGLLLGFFMSASVNRWWACVDGFLALFDAIRNIQMQLIALGVMEEKVDTCLRYGVLSAWILSLQLRTEKLSSETQAVAMDAMWDMLEQEQGANDCQWRMLPAEVEIVKKCEDPSGLMWIWVSSYLGHLAVEGDVPAMPTPTWGRLIQLAKDAHGGIRIVRSSISVQAPFIYVQMLASLVHINNIINAVSFGLTLGSAVGTIIEHSHKALFEGKATYKEAARDSQNLLVSFFFSCFGPFIYHALLEVSICIASPFSGTDGEIPTWRLLRRLERDLKDGKMMAEQISWPKPVFKQASVAASPRS